MLRRSLAALAIALTGLVVMSGTAMAAPTYAPATLTITSEGGGVYTVTGGNFGTPEGSDSSVDVTVGYTAPSGLRHSAGLAQAAAAAMVSIVPDADGNFSTTVNLTQVGTAVVTAVGSPSGKTASASVVVGSGTATTTTVVVTGPAYVTPGGTYYDSSGSLASTGASIAGPIAIGAAALLAGLALLFFGTRGVIRRKGSQSTVG